jgi:hypothetical protein
MPGVSVRDLVLVFHVLFGSITAGATISYAFWLALAELEPDHLPFAIRAIRHSDRLLAIPAFLLTLRDRRVARRRVALPDRRAAAHDSCLYAVVPSGFSAWGPPRHELTALEGCAPMIPSVGARECARSSCRLTISALAMILALMVVKPT